MKRSVEKRSALRLQAAADGGAAASCRDRLGEEAVLLSRHPQPGLALHDRVPRSPQVQRDDRGATGLRLDGDDPEVLVRREDEQQTRPVELPQPLVGRRDLEPHVGAEARGQITQRLLFGAP